MSQDDWNQGFVTGVVAGVSTASTGAATGGIPYVALTPPFATVLITPIYVTLVLIG